MLEDIYHLRNSFIVIGLTGRKGSEYSLVADYLCSEDISWAPNVFDEKEIAHNSQRKYNIVHKYLSKNWKPFNVLKYKDVLSLILLDLDFTSLRGLIEEYFNNGDLLGNLQGEFEKLKCEFNLITDDDKINKVSKERDLELLYDFYFKNPDFNKYSKEFHDLLESESATKRINFLQHIADNCRQYGTPTKTNTKKKSDANIYFIAEVINRLIKSYRACNKKQVQVVIDSLRNPIEIMFFKERYSAFYMMAINSRKPIRDYRIKKYYNDVEDEVKRLDEEEYKVKSNNIFTQDISSCIQKSDIHLNSSKLDISDEEIEEFLGVEQVEEKQLPQYLTMKQYLLQYIALILHPGLITPSPQERCMQIAYNAKYNSGCISRQVGAVITDEYYSVKGIGWNNTPENQVPCLLRNANDLTSYWNGDSEYKYYKESYSEYERTNLQFKKVINDKYNLNCNEGYNLSYCFKNVQNEIEGNKNQVHTRSLHAEENAFLQITKYGGSGIKDGNLFTTASPCELCSKKAYQLGVKKVYYIDPYPGISKEHILQGGSNNPKLILFTGAIGGAFHKLYEPFMSFKDEIAIAKGIKFEDKTKALEEENSKLKALLKEKNIPFE